jgi:hypothetical protein
VTSPLRPFRSSIIFTECEQCRRTVDLTRLGACARCRRVLCNTHLHGSFFRRLYVDIGAEAVCVKCRLEQPAP